jgi:hypothetical protein
MKAHLILLSLLLILPACRGPHYKIQLRDGREIIAVSQPEFQTKTGYYRYVNIQGKDALVLREEVLLIEEQ